MKQSPDEWLAPFLTPDGYLDLTKLPIDSVLRDGMSRRRTEFRNGLRTLHVMAEAGREEAAVFLLGLFVAAPADDLERRREIMENLRGVAPPACVDLLLAELRRVKSNNTTRTYLNALLRTLFSFPLELIEPGVRRLLDDKVFSYRRHTKIRTVLEQKKLAPKTGWRAFS